MADPSLLWSEDAVRDRVARHVEVRREEIVREWVNAVLSDPAIPSSDKLTFSALKDHFPEMLQELAEVIRHRASGTQEDDIQTTAAAHGKARWRNGYKLDEVLRELSRVHHMLVREILDVVGGPPPAVVEPISRDVDHFFCLVGATSALQFAEAQKAALLLQDQQLTDAYEQTQSGTAQGKEGSASRLRLLRAVSHELRNAVQPILLAAALLKESSAWDRELDASMTSSASKLQVLLAALPEISLLLAGKSPVEIEKFTFFQLLEYLESKHPAAEEKGLCFETHLRSTNFAVYSDLAKVKAIAGELVDNAIKFTASGFIRVEIGESGEDHWTLRVADSGQGIEPNLARQIFGELHSPPLDLNAGARLGLVVSHHLAHLLGGELSFVTTPLNGSTFQLNLPRERSPA